MHYCTLNAFLLSENLLPHFLCYINIKSLLHTFHAIQLSSSLCFSLSHSLSHSVSSAPQITAENLQSCTVSLILFNWDFLIHTFSLLMAPTVKHYQKEQTICASITSYYARSIFHFKLTDGTAFRCRQLTQVHSVIPLKDTVTC